MDLIKKMESARSAHFAWARHQEYRRRHGIELIPHVGGSSHHRRWIKIYDAVIKELNNGNHQRR